MTPAPRTYRTFPPPPPEFAQQFAIGGWERVELLYGARSDVIRKWIHLTGAKPRHPKGGKRASAIAVNTQPHAV